jgi:tetratricopeptide (TPR) repeat protein
MWSAQRSGAPVFLLARGFARFDEGLVAVNRTKVLEAAQKFLSKGQYDKAIAEYQKLVAEDPRDVRTLLKIGDLHTRRNKPKDAIEIYERVAELYAKQGFFLKAVAVYKQILKLDPAHLESTLKLAQMYEELALASDALTTYEQAADAFLALGQTEKALDTMQRMIALDGQNVAARIKFAEALSKANRAREAATAFADGARLLREQGRIDDYVRVVERQLYHDPENVSIARELSGRYLERNDPKRALAKLQVCFKADPRDVQTLEMLAEAFRQLGQIPKTVSVLKEIARLHAEVNAEEPRRRTLLRVLDLDPTDSEARQALATPAARAARSPQAEPARATTAPTSTGARAQAPVARPSVEVVELDEGHDDDDEAELSLDDAEQEGSDALLMVAEDSMADEGAEGGVDEGDPSVASLLAEAEGYESNGDYDRAERALRDALLLEEESTEIHERLKDVYLATDRRVEAVRELLWLSEAVEANNPSQAQNYARTAYDLAPHAEATRYRIEQLGLQPDADEPSLGSATEEVVFVDDSESDMEPSTAFRPGSPAPLDEQTPFPTSAPTERERPSARAAAASVEAGNLDPLDVPFSPDEFEAAVPQRRGTNALRGDLLALLDRPISADEFDRAEANDFDREADFDRGAADDFDRADADDFDRADADDFDRPDEPGATEPAGDVAALLDAPISPDEFDALPPSRPGARPAFEHARTAYELLDDPVDDFGLSDARFDRSDLHEVGPEPQSARLTSEPPTLEVVEEENYDELLSDDLELGQSGSARTIAPGPSRELAPSLDDLADADAALTDVPQAALAGEDEDWSGDLPEPTVPAEPIPELIRRSSQANLDAIGQGLETVRPAQSANAAELPSLAPEELAPAPVAAAPVIPAPVAAAPVAAPAPFVPAKPAPIAVVARPAPPAAPVAAVVHAAPVAAKEVLTPEIEEALDEAEFFASQGLLDEALEVVQEAILIYPRSAALKTRLQEYETRADEKDAQAAAQAAAKEDELGLDESFDIAEQLASELAEVPAPSAHDEMIDVESVFAQFKKGVAAQISEDDTDTHFDLGIAYKEMGLTNDAIGEFELSAKSPKRACIAWTMVGMCHLEKGDAHKAVSFFERALSQPHKAASEELALSYEIGNAYEQAGQLEKALLAFERVAARDRTFRGVVGRIDQLKRRGVSASASGATG